MQAARAARANVQGANAAAAPASKRGKKAAGGGKKAAAAAAAAAAEAAEAEKTAAEAEAEAEATAAAVAAVAAAEQAALEASLRPAGMSVTAEQAGTSGSGGEAAAAAAVARTPVGDASCGLGGRGIDVGGGVMVHVVALDSHDRMLSSLQVRGMKMDPNPNDPWGCSHALPARTVPTLQKGEPLARETASKS